MAKTILHESESRGGADHGWLHTRHTFSFADYHDPERVNFGALRVLNDDIIEGGMGFDMHPHSNMEIITIPLEGALEHKDSKGNNGVIEHGDVQVMSAGTGIYHSEYNKNKDKPVKLLQIWVFTNKRNVTPRYGQITMNLADRHNRLQQIISPFPGDKGLWIYQNAWFFLGNLDSGFETEYNMKASGNGLYVFVIDGNVNIADHQLKTRDGLGIWDTEKVQVRAESNAEILLMDVPMTY